MIVKLTRSDINIDTGTLSAIGRIYGPIIPVIKDIGKKAIITARVATIIGGRTSLTANKTDSLGGRSFSLKCRYIFSTSTIGSSHTNPSVRIKANNVTLLIEYPTSILINKVREKAIGTAKTTIRPSRHPNTRYTRQITVRSATKSFLTSSFTFSLAISPKSLVTTQCILSGITECFNSSIFFFKFLVTHTALVPFRFANAIVTAG